MDVVIVATFRVLDSYYREATELLQNPFLKLAGFENSEDTDNIVRYIMSKQVKSRSSWNVH